jgi:hypothetical protein
MDQVKETAVSRLEKLASHLQPVSESKQEVEEEENLLVEDTNGALPRFDPLFRISNKFAETRPVSQLPTTELERLLKSPL